MAKKGLIQEIISKAKFVDDTDEYKITYRDFEFLREMTFTDFMKESKNFEKIPIWRINMIKKNNKILFKKGFGEA